MRKALLTLSVFFTLSAQAQDAWCVNHLRNTISPRNANNEIFVPFGDTNIVGSKGGVYQLCDTCYGETDDSMTTISVFGSNSGYVWHLVRQLTFNDPGHLGESLIYTCMATIWRRQVIFQDTLNTQ